MSRKNSSYLDTSSFDSKVLNITIAAIIFISFFIRLKVLRNVRNFDMSIIPNVPNIFTYYKLVLLVALVAILSMLLIYRNFRYKIKFRTDYIFIGTGLVIVTSLIATFLSEYSDIALLGAYQRTNGMFAYISLFTLIYILSNLKIQSKHLSFLVHAVNAASIVFVIIGIFQFVGLDPLNAEWMKKLYIPAAYANIIGKINILQMKYPNLSYYWASSIFSHYNYFGAYCSIIFPIVTSFAINESNIYKRIILSLGSIMLFASVLQAQSLGSWVALLAVLLIMPFLLLNKNNYKNYIGIHIGYAITSVVLYILTKGNIFAQLTDEIGKITFSGKLKLLLIIFVIFYAVLLFIWKRFVKNRFRTIAIVFILMVLIVGMGYTYFINSITHDEMGIFTSRGYIWYYANKLIKENLIIGYGPDTFFYNFPQINQYKAEFLPENLVDKPHDMYLQYMLDIGIFGLIGFLIILIVSFIKYAKAAENEADTAKQNFMLGMQLVIIAYMIQGFINDNHLVIQPILFTLIGVGAALINNISIIRLSKNDSK